jgi:ferric-dicitrate binding protein FerR (iron transport regulator)
MNYDEATTLAVIIIKVKLRKASPGERERLFAWLDEREENRYLYKRIIRGEGLRDHFRLEDEFLQLLNVDRMTKIIVGKLVRRQRVNALRKVRRIAAVACLAGALVVSYFFVAPLFPGEPPVEEFPFEVPSRVKLILPSGDQVSLEREYPREMMIATTLLSSGVDGLSLLDGEGVAADNTITGDSLTGSMWCQVVTSTGGQYHVRLQDGTEIWINAASELEFPVTFAADRRVVRLKGEGFFKVSPSRDRPFIVETGGVETRVLGTSFNVRAYEEDERVAVTLLAGQVEVSAGATVRSLQLSPGMAAVWTRATGMLERRMTRAENAIAWRDGLFIFTGEELEQVTRTLSRWHGARFLYSDPETKRLLFTGRISMEETMENVLESITIAGGPAFRVDGDVIHVLK